MNAQIKNESSFENGKQRCLDKVEVKGVRRRRIREKKRERERERERKEENGKRVPRKRR